MLRGRILDERDNGVERAVVYRHGWGDGPVPGVWSAVSGEQGYYEITDLPPWRAGENGGEEPGLGFPSDSKHSRMLFSVRKRGYARGEGRYGELPATVDVGLKAAAVLEGKVLDGVTGKPVAGATVHAEGVEDLPGGGKRSRFGGHAVTDGAGRYRLDSLDGGSYRLWARFPGRVVAPLEAVPATAGKTAGVPDFVLTEGGFVTGRVLDVDAGMPIGRTAWGSRVRVSASRGGVVLDSVPVADDGTFRARATPGMTHVYVQLGQDIRDRSIRKDASVEVKEGETATLPSFKIRLQRPAEGGQ